MTKPTGAARAATTSRGGVAVTEVSGLVWQPSERELERFEEWTQKLTRQDDYPKASAEFLYSANLFKNIGAWLIVQVRKQAD